MYRRIFNPLEDVAQRFRRPVSDKPADNWRKPLLGETVDKLSCLMCAKGSHLLPARQLSGTGRKRPSSRA